MYLLISRRVFLVVASGNAAAQFHFEDTIQRQRTLDEVRRFLPARKIENLEKIYHGPGFIVWGAVPGPDEREPIGEDATGRRGAHLQPWPKSFRLGDRREGDESGPGATFLEARRVWQQLKVGVPCRANAQLAPVTFSRIFSSDENFLEPVA
jgi:hypothetical protein